MMVYVPGINERFNSDIVKTNNKNQYIYQSTHSIKDSVHTTSSSICKVVVDSNLQVRVVFLKSL